MGWLTEASTNAAGADRVFLWIFWLSVAFLVAITAVMITFVIRYSRKRNPRPEQVESHTVLEITWTVVPLLMFMGMFYFGWTNFEYTRNPPRDAMPVKVTGRQWSWSFEYPNGKQTTELYAALGKPMKLEIRSADVIHGFFVPAFRLKMDAVPGKLNVTWFEPTQLGTYDIECTVICGVNHSYMLSKVVVVSDEEFIKWYFGDQNAPLPGKGGGSAGASAAAVVEPADPGYSVLKGKACLTCHSVDGKPMVGPTFKGLFGSKVTVLARGAEYVVTADEAFVRRSIREPSDEIAKGYPPAMPSAALSDAELGQAVSYIESLR